MIEDLPELRTLVERAVEVARRMGAEGAEAEVRATRELGVKVRRGKPELVHHARSRTLGMRLLKDQRAALVFTNDLAPAAIESLIREGLDLTSLATPDPMNGLAPRNELARHPLPNLNLWDDDTLLLDVREALRRAAIAERIARDFDPRVSHAESSCGHTLEGLALASSAGFSGAYATSYQALMVESVCDDVPPGKSISRYFTASRFLAELQEPELVGREAARRAVQHLGAHEMRTCELPVLFHPDAGRALLQLVPQVTNSTAMYKRASYLVDREGQRVASPLLDVIDDPMVPRAVGSRPFDGEGLRSRGLTIVKSGVLRTIMCDVYGARRLRRPPTGSAARKPNQGPSVGVSNFIMLPGTTRVADMIAQTDSGLYVTDVMGASFNPMTGDLARAVAGFRIEGGELGHPVSRLNLATQLDTILTGIDMIGDDLDFRTAFACPTFRVNCLLIGGR